MSRLKGLNPNAALKNYPIILSGDQFTAADNANEISLNGQFRKCGSLVVQNIALEMARQSVMFSDAKCYANICREWYFEEAFS